MGRFFGEAIMVPMPVVGGANDVLGHFAIAGVRLRLSIVW